MKYTKEQRLNIGQQIYEGRFTRFEAAEVYHISEQTARDYMRMYRDTNLLPPKNIAKDYAAASAGKNKPVQYETLNAMTKEELIRLLLDVRLTEAQLLRFQEKQPE